MSEQTLFPAFRYRDARAAVDWLGRAFGFEPRMVVDGEGDAIAHAELVLGRAMIMLGSIRDGDGYAPPPGGAAVYVVVEDPDAHTSRRGRPARRSCASRPRPTTARASTPPATPRATTGASARTSPGRAEPRQPRCSSGAPQASSVGPGGGTL